ncbi:MAG: LysM peptidoglycan-binding domain-containing protein [Bacteroidetes bacterium]|nr:LysM peptidoglycan-binding domain-containing protein [Bacteroidota bacterium]MBU2583954.1 LysM peptidoglycan-binding domain-containing protein [Bacteroidota bacterium]
MKLNRLFLPTLIFIVAITSNLFAQYEEWDADRWTSEMNNLKARKESLLKEKAALNAAIADLKKTSQQDVDECMNELYALVGATKADVDAFRRQVSELDSKIKTKQPNKNERQAELDVLKKNEISALPEFFDKVHNQMQSALNNWIDVAPEKVYTVVRGDCLWNIAKKKTIYDNAFAWPKIFQSNKDQIRNPDLIYPKQAFKIAELNQDEVAKYHKMRVTWRKLQQ